MAQSDWDFSTSDWLIDNLVYFSSPSSIKTTATTLVILSKHSGCTNLEEGRLVTQLRGSTTTSLIVLFVRNQAAVGSPAFQNTYVVIRRLDGNLSYCYVARYEAGASVWSASFYAAGMASLSANTWYQYRVTWWRDWQGIRFRMALYTGGAWVTDGIDVTDPADKWVGSGINRPGMRGLATMWYDDTEIWGVA